MGNNSLIPYKQNIFTKIRTFLKNLFSRKKEEFIEDEKENIFQKNYYNNNFSERIAVKVDEEQKRLKDLQRQYDNGEIDEEDITAEDIDKLVEMYEAETERLNADTEMRKMHISEMLIELKNT